MITDLDTIRNLTNQRREEFTVLMYRLQYDDDINDKTIDTAVNTLAEPIINAIDCTRCGNCCRALRIALKPVDIQPIAEVTNQTSQSVCDDLVDFDFAQKHGEWGVFKASPCSFLTGNRCSIYAHRPQACRDYPFITPDFRWTMDELIEGAAICPIIYNVLSQVADQIDSWQLGNWPKSNVNL